MPLYEHVFLARQDVSAQQVEELTAQIKGVIEQMGGKIAKLEQWGVKSLSYRLRKNRKAHLHAAQYRCAVRRDQRDRAPGAAQRRRAALLTIRVDEHEEGPSAMMRKVDRDRERDDRGFGFRDRDGAAASGIATATVASTVVIVTATAARRARAPSSLPC